MRAATFTVVVCLFAAPARASDAFLTTEALVAKPVANNPGAAPWDKLPGLTVPLASQRSIHLNDRAANAALGGAPRAVTVRAAYDQRELAVLLEWSDDTCDRSRSDETISFGDSAALELPLQFGAKVRLPYIGMGDDQQRVALYHARAGEKETIGREAVAAGFGSSTRADLGDARMEMRYDDAHKRWRALFVRPLQTSVSDLRQGLVPFAIAVWDGNRSERGGNKGLSSWKFLRLERYPLNGDYLREVSYGYAPGAAGELARGKMLVEAMCTTCHVIGDKHIAPPGLAPELSTIGAIATPSYLRESIVSPSAIIVPNPNVNQHYNRTLPADAYGAYPNNDQFVWYARDAAGKKVSRMPPFGLAPADVAAMVTYLRTLGRTP